MLAVRAPDGIGVISSLLRDCDGASGEHVIDVDGCIGAERVLLAHLLPAAVGYVPAVGSPIQLLYAAERLGGELEAVVGPENVEGIVGSNLAVDQRSHIAAGDFGHPMVPVAVHKVLGSIGLSLVERRIGIGGLDHCRVLDGRGVDYLLSVGRYLELADSCGNIAELDLLPELAGLEGGFVELPALHEIDGIAIVAPAGAVHAFLLEADLLLSATVGLADIDVPEGIVFFDVLVIDSVEYLAPIRRELGVGNAAERE